MEVITPSHLREDYENSTEDERKDLIRGLVKMAGQGLSSDEAGWRAEFVRWAYVRARSDGEFTLVAPLDGRVRQQIQRPSVFEKRPEVAIAGIVGGIVIFILVGMVAGPGAGSVGGLLGWRLIFLGYKKYFKRTDTSDGRWIEPR